MMYNIYAGLGGGFGGANYIGTIDCESLEDAYALAREYAVEEYDSYSGMYGVVDRGDIYNNPEDFGLDEDWDEEDVDDVLDEEINSWIDYWAVPEDEDEDLDDEDKEYL